MSQPAQPGYYYPQGQQQQAYYYQTSPTVQPSAPQVPLQVNTNAPLQSALYPQQMPQAPTTTNLPYALPTTAKPTLQVNTAVSPGQPYAYSPPPAYSSISWSPVTGPPQVNVTANTPQGSTPTQPRYN